MGRNIISWSRSVTGKSTATRFLARVLLALLFSTSLHAQTSHLVTTLFPTGPGSLGHYITNSSSGDTIRFDPNLFVNGSDTLYTGSPLVFSHGLVIEGHMQNGDTLYISGMGQSQVFLIDFSANPLEDVTFENVAIIDGYTFSVNGTLSTFGGGIYSKGLRKLNLKNCLIRNCSAGGQGIAGGLCFRDIDTVTLNSCIFQRNYTDSNLTNGALGGALYCFNSALVVIDTRFVGNSSAKYGGAIATSLSYLLIENCDFLQNAVVQPTGAEGGAIDCIFGPAPIIRESRFVGNSSQNRAGVISFGTNDSSTMIIEGCLFQNNSSVAS